MAGGRSLPHVALGILLDRFLHLDAEARQSVAVVLAANFRRKKIDGTPFVHLAPALRFLQT